MNDIEDSPGKTNVLASNTKPRSPLQTMGSQPSIQLPKELMELERGKNCESCNFSMNKIDEKKYFKSSGKNLLSVIQEEAPS